MTASFPGTRRAAFFVWGTLALLLMADLAFVACFGSDVPSWDDWDMVPIIAGVRPVTLDWLWSQHNEHRVPVPRLLELGLYRLRPDFRVPMGVNVLVTAMLALAMVRAAKRLRGGLSYTDAFFPLLLLNLGQGLNFIWAWQLEFFLSTALAGAVLILVARSPSFRTSTMAMIGACVLLLGLCGAHGLALLPAFAAWLAGTALLNWRSADPRARRASRVAVGVALGALLLTALYLVGYRSAPYFPTSSGLRQTFSTAVQFLTMGFGPAIRPPWPASGIGMLVLLFLTLGLLGRVFWREAQERYRALGLLGFLAAMITLGLAIGLGRNGFEPRYITLSAPALCVVYLAWSLYGPPSVNRPARTVLLLATLLTFLPNTEFGLAYASDLRSRLGSLERDLAMGVPSPLLIRLYHAHLNPHPDLLADYLPMLRQAGVGQFRLLRETPPLHRIAVPLVPAALRDVLWQQGTASAAGRDPYLEFELPEDRYVYGVCLRYNASNASVAFPFVTISWIRNGREPFDRSRCYKYYPTGDRANWKNGAWTRRDDPDTTATAWVCDRVRRLRIEPDLKPGALRMLELALLVPAED